MKVIKTAAITAALRTLADDERLKVLSWFDQLGNWENDEQVRRMTKKTIYRDTYALNTSDDIRIFFTLNEADGEIVVIDLARPSRFEFAGAASE
ncbi:hypothetical protein [Fimbriiglobus ruber]|uniref:Uncharacterized protein n=1 Tax=Fimbriiglobus ruber TaxID=1908690 RepID=A0A225E142_9BACT|nr:hypothetical protein [Fimbriiglobus ruber]OWK46913.1 hypothetical protein FRUB_00612 [Fimbriiglobus ruber]